MDWFYVFISVINPEVTLANGNNCTTSFSPKCTGHWNTITGRNLPVKNAPPKYIL